MSRRVLVTGGAGFIGSHLVRRLVEEGDDVRVLDDLSTGKRENLLEVADSVELVEGDLRDPSALGRAVAGCECVFHEAALPSVPRSIVDPITSHEVNATGTLLVLEAARQAGVRRLVYAASSSAYGETETLPKSEDLPTSPLSPYGVSKLAGELYARVYAVVHGMETVSLRYFNVFGPRQDPDSPYAAVIPLFIARLSNGERPKIYGDGEQSRDFTYVENVVEANLLASKAAGLGGVTVNVACGAQTTLNELAGLLGEILGGDATPEYSPPRPGDIRHSYADISTARRILGYRPRVDLRDGLRRTAEWFLAARK